MDIRIVLAFIISGLLVSGEVYSQDEENAAGFFFGPKIGLSVATQNWNGAERRPLFNNHLALFIESLDPDLAGSLFAQIGYHSRGSSLAVNNILSGTFSNRGFIYKNLSFMAGAKKRFHEGEKGRAYYLFGVRAEYNLHNNLRELQSEFALGASALFYPLEEFVNKVTYGLTIGGGLEFWSSKFFQPAIEFNFSPDINFQYRDGPFDRVINPFNGQPQNIPERSIRNVTFEVTLVLRFLREVIYE